MKVLFLCYDLGKYTTGITNKRILKGLLDNGIDCRVISGNHSDVIDSSQLYVCSAFPNRPSRFFSILGDIIGRDLDYFFWEKRAKRKAMEICKYWTPDIVYARANPPAVFLLGLFISKKIKKALFLHSGDPIPPTPDWNSNRLYRRKKINAVINPLKNANAISFINHEMINYEQSLLPFDILQRSFISPNPVLNGLKNESIVDFKGKNSFVCIFLGSFYGNRSPKLLFDVAKKLNEIYNYFELHLIGTDINALKAYLINNKLPDYIKILPRVDNVSSFLRTADLLIDIDADYTPQVFISNKLMDYLPIEKPILCLTPNGSASRNLLRNCNKSIVFSNYNFTELFNALNYLINTPFNDYSDRDSVINQLSVSTIVKELISRFEKYA